MYVSEEKEVLEDVSFSVYYRYLKFGSSFFVLLIVFLLFVGVELWKFINFYFFSSVD